MPSKKTKENQAVSFFKNFLEPDLVINFLICFATFCMVSFYRDLLRQDACSQLALCSLCVCSVTSAMSDSLQHHGLQPTRLLWSMGFSRQEYWSGLPCPPPGDLPDPGTESLSQATPVLAGGFFTTGIMFFAMPMYLVMSDSLQPFGLQPTRLLCLWGFPGKNIGAGCHFLLQGIFPSQESNPRLLCRLHCRRILYQLSHQGSLFFKAMIFKNSLMHLRDGWLNFHEVRIQATVFYSRQLILLLLFKGDRGD